MRRKYRNAWSQLNNYCLECKTTKYKHQAKGLCTSCYRKKWKKNYKISDRYKQVRKKYTRFLKSLEGKGKWARLEQQGRLAKFEINDRIITIPMTVEDMDYWDSEYEFKFYRGYLQNKYGNKYSLNRLKRIL